VRSRRRRRRPPREAARAGSPRGSVPRSRSTNDRILRASDAAGSPRPRRRLECPRVRGEAVDDGVAPWPAASRRERSRRGSLTIRKSGHTQQVLRGRGKYCLALRNARLQWIIHERRPSRMPHDSGGHAPGPCASRSERREHRTSVVRRGEEAPGRERDRRRRGVGCRAPRGPISRGRVGVVKLLRARGGCLGVASKMGVGGRDSPGGAAERASIPGCPWIRGELKHLSTRGRGNQPRLPQ
jgi:hypothetical protein